MTANPIFDTDLSSRVAEGRRQTPSSICALTATIPIFRTSPQFAHSLSFCCDSQTEHLSRACSGSGTRSCVCSSNDVQKPKNMMVVGCETGWNRVGPSQVQAWALVTASLCLVLQSRRHGDGTLTMTTATSRREGVTARYQKQMTKFASQISIQPNRG